MRRCSCLAVVAVVALAGCAIREDAAPRVIPIEDRAAFGEIATGDVAEGGGRIYLLSPVGADEATQLRAVRRRGASSPGDLLESLLAGANEDETAQGLSSVIPSDLEILEARTVGTRLTIDINDALNELSGLGLRQALAQIVATAVEIDQVQLVRIRVQGENQGWPIGDGEITDQPLSIYDYPGVLETSQPSLPALPST